jgi:hypothetical protein
LASELSEKCLHLIFMKHTKTFVALAGLTVLRIGAAN